MESEENKTRAVHEQSAIPEPAVFGPDGRVLESSAVERQREEVAGGTAIEESTDQFELVGDDKGERRVLSTMNIVAVNHQGQNLSREEVLQIAMKHFANHFKEIGWYPTGEYGPDVSIKKRDDGSWLAVAWLGKGTGRVTKEWEDFPRVGIDSRTEKEARSNKTIHTIGK